MYRLNKIFYFFTFLFILLLIYSFQLNIGPWDEYHLLYYFKNQSFFPFYDYNFPYYDTYFLGRFSPLAGQEFNILIFITSNISYSYIFLVFIIFISFILFYYLIKINLFNTSLKFIIIFVLIIFSTPSFYLLSSRLLYVEDMQVLILLIFLLSFSQSINSNIFNKKIFWKILLIISTFSALLYKENNFLIISSFILIYFIYEKKQFQNFKTIPSIIIILSLFYVLALGYINLFYKNNDISYIQNSNNQFLLSLAQILLKYIINDIILFLIILPFGVYGLKISKNTFIKSIFLSGLLNILFFIFLGLYGPYYLYPCYFLMFPLCFQTLYQINFKNRALFNLLKISMVLLTLISFNNSIFYYFESKSLSSTFNKTVNYLVNDIKNNETKTNIYMCNYLNAGNLAKLYILGEHIKYNNINSNKFNLFSLSKNKQNNFYSKRSPFDEKDNNQYEKSIFNNNQIFLEPKEGDIIINLPIYSSKNEKSCSFLRDQPYSGKISYSSSFYNTLITNLAKVVLYRKDFVKENFIKKFEYEIFKL